MQDTLRSTMRSVQNQPHDEEFDLGESSSLRGTVRSWYLGTRMLRTSGPAAADLR